MITLRTVFILALLWASLVLAQSVPRLRPFDDDAYRKVLRENSRVLLYAFSPQMNLSVEGIKEIRRAALNLRARVIFLADPVGREEEILGLAETREIGADLFHQKSNTLRNAGIQLHYPSVVIVDRGRIAGAPIPGFKSSAAYVTLVAGLLKLPTREVFELAESIALPRQMNAFFKPVYGSDLILSGSSFPNYLLNVRTGKTSVLGDTGDPGVTPDGAFLTMLSAGLRWYSVSDILGGNPKVLLSDPGLGTYQSMALLPGTSTYRVLGAETSSTRPTGLKFRDYKTVTGADGRKGIAELGPWTEVCAGRSISIPMLSKTGLFLAGLFEGTQRVFRIGIYGLSCDLVFDSAAITGKADFSADDAHLLYVARNKDVDSVVLADLRAKQQTVIYTGSTDASLAFPGFMSPDRIAVYNQTFGKILILDRNRVLK